jgi:hypothetical protein
MMLMSSQAPAAEKSVQLLSGTDLLSVGRAQITQGLTAESSGSILYPDQILSVSAKSALKDTPADPRIAEWSKVYRFVVLPFSIAVQPKPGTVPKTLVVNAAFRNTGQTTKQPIIIDIFPSTAFKAGPLTANASASVGLGTDLKFAGAAPVDADASVKAALAYTYAPAFANVQTGYSSSACFWQFLATQSEQPVGSLPLKLTVAVPLAVSAMSIALNFEVVASFGGSWFGDDVRANFVAEVLLPKP